MSVKMHVGAGAIALEQLGFLGLKLDEVAPLSWTGGCAKMKAIHEATI